MEQKNKLKPNVRIEPKTSPNKVNIKNPINSEENYKDNASAINKADDMEAGFVKTRKTTISHDLINTNMYHDTVNTNMYHDTVNTNMHHDTVNTNMYHDTVNTNTPHEAVNTNTNQKTSSNDDILFTLPTVEKTHSFKNSNTPESNTISTNNKKGLQIVLSPSACITAFVTVLVTMSFIFIFGLIIGKGMVPTPTKIEPEKLTPRMQKVEEKTEVLPKEQLTFMTSLKKEQIKETTIDEETDTKKPKIEAEKITPVKIIPSTRLYDFNIRVAAFRSETQADTLRAQLEGKGFRTLKIIEKDGKGKNWYFIHVLLRGTETRLEEARESFKKFAIRDSIIKEQTEVK